MSHRVGYWCHYYHLLICRVLNNLKPTYWNELTRSLAWSLIWPGHTRINFSRAWKLTTTSLVQTMSYSTITSVVQLPQSIKQITAETPSLYSHPSNMPGPNLSTPQDAVIRSELAKIYRRYCGNTIPAWDRSVPACLRAVGHSTLGSRRNERQLLCPSIVRHSLLNHFYCRKFTRQRK